MRSLNTVGPVIFFWVYLITCCPAHAKGGTSGGGGDIYAAHFDNVGKQILQVYTNICTRNESAEDNYYQVCNYLENFHEATTHKIIPFKGLKGVGNYKRDGGSDEDGNILLNISEYKEIIKKNELHEAIVKFVAHEYFIAADLEKLDQYNISSQLLNMLKLNKVNFNKLVISLIKPSETDDTVESILNANEFLREIIAKKKDLFVKEDIDLAINNQHKIELAVTNLREMISGKYQKKLEKRSITFKASASHKSSASYDYIDRLGVQELAVQAATRKCILASYNICKVVYTETKECRKFDCTAEAWVKGVDDITQSLHPSNYAGEITDNVVSLFNIIRKHVNKLSQDEIEFIKKQGRLILDKSVILNNMVTQKIINDIDLKVQIVDKSIDTSKETWEYISEMGVKRKAAENALNKCKSEGYTDCGVISSTIVENSCKQHGSCQAIAVATGLKRLAQPNQ